MSGLANCISFHPAASAGVWVRRVYECDGLTDGHTEGPHYGNICHTRWNHWSIIVLYTNLHFTYLLAYLLTREFIAIWSWHGHYWSSRGSSDDMMTHAKSTLGPAQLTLVLQLPTGCWWPRHCRCCWWWWWDNLSVVETVQVVYVVLCSSSYLVRAYSAEIPIACVSWVEKFSS